MEERPPASLKPDTSAGFHPRFALRPHQLDLCFRLARLDGAFERFDVHAHWLEILRKDAYVKNAHSSTSIEGNPLDLEAAKAVARSVESGSARSLSRDELEIVQHLGYFRSLEDLRVSPPSRFTPEEIEAAHRALLSGVLDSGVTGRFRGPALPRFVYFGRNEGTPPDRVEGELRALLAWWSDEARTLPGPVRAAIWFLEFESIHPFTDGNGRVGRALTHRLLLTEGLPYSLLAPLDVAFNRNREAYHAALDAGRENLQAWVDYFLQCLADAYDAAHAILRRLSSVPAGFRGAQHEVLAYAIRSGATELRVAPLVRAIEDYRPITVSFALKALADEHGLLAHNGKRGRASAYIPTPKLRALARLAPS